MQSQSQTNCRACHTPNGTKVECSAHRTSSLRWLRLRGSMHNIYLKVGNEFTKLIGIHSPSSFGYNDNQLVYTGKFEDVQYKVVYTLFASTYFVDVILAPFPTRTVASSNLVSPVKSSNFKFFVPFSISDNFILLIISFLLNLIAKCRD